MSNAFKRKSKPRIILCVMIVVSRLIFAQNVLKPAKISSECVNIVIVIFELNFRIIKTGKGSPNPKRRRSVKKKDLT